MKKEPITTKLFGWHIYFSHRRLRLMPPSPRRGNHLARRLRELRNRRFRRTHGHCEICGNPSEKETMQLHHILPYGEFPNLGQKRWNLLLLCPRCHYLIHKNPVEQVAQMQRVAHQHGIDLSHEFHAIASRRWQEKQQKGGAL